MELVKQSCYLNDLKKCRMVTIPSQIGEYVSQFRMAMILGISAKQVARLEALTNHELPPAIKLACQYIEQAGLVAAESHDDPAPEDVEYVVSSIMLTREQTATCLGKHRQVLYSLCTGRDQATVKRFFLLALLYLQQLYGISPELRRLLDVQLADGERYRDRAKQPERKTTLRVLKTPTAQPTAPLRKVA